MGKATRQGLCPPCCAGAPWSTQWTPDGTAWAHSLSTRKAKAGAEEAEIRSMGQVPEVLRGAVWHRAVHSQVWLQVAPPVLVPAAQ